MPETVAGITDSQEAVLNCSPYLAWLCHSPFSFTVSPGLRPGMLPTIVTRPALPSAFSRATV